MRQPCFDPKKSIEDAEYRNAEIQVAEAKKELEEAAKMKWKKLNPQMEAAEQKMKATTSSTTINF